MTMEYYKRIGSECKSTITIQKSHALMIPACLLKTINERWCFLGYDSEKNQLGIQLLKEKLPGAKKVSVDNNGNGRVSGIGFLKHYGLKHEVSRRYVVERNEDILLIDLGDKS